MKRAIVQIDSEKCNGCGQCISACHEGAIALVGGKAKLVSDVYCDGLGACLGKCPVDAITIVERDAAEFDQAAVERHLAKPVLEVVPPMPCGCPGSMARSIVREESSCDCGCDCGAEDSAGDLPPSALSQWPVQLRLVNPAMPALQGADLLICADCAPFAVADFHQRYLQHRAIVVGCPKLDDQASILSKLTAIFAQAKPKSVTLLRMEVPCCGGLAHAAIQARQAAKSQVSIEVHTIGIESGIEIDSI